MSKILNDYKADGQEIEKMRPSGKYEKVLWLREKSGTEFYNKYNSGFVECPCPACESRDGKLIFKKYGYQHIKCDNCFTIWCSPRPTESMLLDYYFNYEATKFWTQLLIQSDADRKSIQHVPRVNHLIKILKELGWEQKHAIKIADIGAGSGAFALSLKQSNFFSEVLAVDTSADCCIACESLGLNTAKGSIDIIDDNSFNIITLNDIVEHLFDPQRFLIQCREKLVSKGVISIACPNGEGFDFSLMGEKTVNITPPEHLNYFNTNSLKLLLKKTGFKVISIETPGILDVQIVKAALNQNKIDLNDNVFLKKIIINSDNETLLNFQTFLRENRLSSHMIVFAIKL